MSTDTAIQEAVDSLRRLRTEVETEAAAMRARLSALGMLATTLEDEGTDMARVARVMWRLAVIPTLTAQDVMRDLPPVYQAALAEIAGVAS